MLPFDQDNEYLPIKTAAEYFYCERAAFYMVMRWENNLENRFLYKGSQQHATIERIPYKHRAAGKISYRQFVVSHTNKIYGFCDAVEQTRAGSMCPVEYKTGKTRFNPMHEAQLHLQAFCLEEMYQRRIAVGFIYFVESSERKRLALDKNKRKIILETVAEFREKLRNPRVSDFKPCGNIHCSYHHIDDPALYSKNRK